MGDCFEMISENKSNKNGLKNINKNNEINFISSQNKEAPKTHFMTHKKKKPRIQNLLEPPKNMRYVQIMLSNKWKKCV